MERNSDQDNQKILARTKKPKILKINPFSLAKFFYERGIDDVAIIQKLIYLTYLEVLDKENILLDLGENWQAWPSGPILEKVFFTMMKDWHENGNYETVLGKTPKLGQEKIIEYCGEWERYYRIMEKGKKQYKLSEESQNQPWKLARSKVNDYLDHEKITTNDIINFVRLRNSSKNSLRA